MTKKLAIWALVIFMALAAPTIAVANACDDWTFNTTMITTGNVNVRSEPNINSKIIGWLDDGTIIFPLRFVSSKDGRMWVMIEYRGRYGYVSDRYLEFFEELPPVLDTSIKLTVTGNTVHVREWASIEAPILDVLIKNTVVNAYSFVCTSDGRIWAEVIYDGTNFGYMSMKYLETEEPLPEFSKNMVVIGRVVNVREYPGTEYDKVGIVKKGDILNVEYFLPMEDGSIWAFCNIDEEYFGYVCAKYLQIVE